MASSRLFNGEATSYLELASLPTELSTEKKIWTVMCWFKPSTVATGGTAVSLGKSAGAGYCALGMTSEKPFAEVGAGTDSTLTTKFTTEKWWMLMMQTNGSTLNVNLNGTGGTGTTAGANTGLNRFTIGSLIAAGSRASWIKGEIAHVAAWNVRLSGTQTKELAEGKNPYNIERSALKFYYPLTSATESLKSYKGEFGGELTEGAAAKFGTSEPTVEAPSESGPVTIPLATAAGTSSTSLSLSAPTAIPLAAAAGAATTSVAVSAPTQIPLASAAGVAATSIALTAPTQIPLAAGAGAATTSLALTAPTAVPLAAAAGASSTSLALTAPTRIALGTAAGSSTTSLTLTAPTKIPLAAAAGTSSTSLSLRAPPSVPLATAAGSSTTSLSLRTPTGIPLEGATGTSTTSLILTTPSPAAPLDWPPSFLSLHPNTTTAGIDTGDSALALLAPATAAELSAPATALAIPHSAPMTLDPGTSHLSLHDTETELDLDG